MMGRAMAWSIVAMPAGMGQGIALGERKVIVNGLVGALLGGLIGGLLFDPLGLLLVPEDGQAILSRGVGFKDGAIEPRHALITNRAGRFEIEDCGTPDGTYVNGIPVTRARVNDGDQIVLGATVLQFSMKEVNRQ
jgi:hypothetical protein